MSQRVRIVAHIPKWTETDRRGKTRADTAQTHGPPPIVFRYVSYYTTLAEHAVLRSVQLDTESVSDVLNGWPHDHGPTNVGAMVKIPHTGDNESLDMCG